MFIQLHDIRSYFQRVGFAFRALSQRNFRLFFIGQIFSVSGTWIQIIALGWLVYRLSDSAFLLGLVGFSSQIPSLLITPFAGVFADRLNRRKVIIMTQSASMVLSFVLGALVLAGVIQPWHIILIAMLNGVINAVDTPFRHAFVNDMIEDKTLMQNAIALNSTLFNSARFIGPTLGGVLIAMVGEGWCFVINGISYLAVIWSLSLMTVRFVKMQHKPKPVIRDLKDGLKYSYHYLPVRSLLLLVVATGFFCLPFQTFLPVYARDILHGNSGLYGLLTGSYGAGALAGAFYLATRKSIRSLPTLILVAGFIFSGGLALFSVSPVSPVSMAILVLAGFGMITQYSSVNTLLQTISERDKIGRVMSLYGMSFMGITPLGSLLLGSLVTVFDVRYVLLASAVISVVFVVFFNKNRHHVQEAVNQIPE